ncbi:MAG: hypothetical protein HY286_11105 [Planctomycetes bacterium]|nr:hypothetical protein [Planctomycetota bacterium]
MLRPRYSSILLVLTFAALASTSLAQGGKKPGPAPPKPGSGGDDGTASKDKTPVKVNIGAVPKGVDEALKKNEDKTKAEAAKVSAQIGADFHGAQGPSIAIYAEEPIDRLQQLVRISETFVAELSHDLEVEPFKDLWAQRLGPFNFYCFKSKSTFGDAYREYLEKRFPSHGLNHSRALNLETGRFIREVPSPLAAGEIVQYESTLAHLIGQTISFFVMREGPPFPSKAAAATPTEGGDEPTKPTDAPKPLTPTPKDKTEDKELEKEELSWLMEGFAMYCSVRFTGSNQMYCVTNSQYVGSLAIADKNKDTAYRLICCEIAQGVEDKAKDFSLLTHTDTNALTYIDLAKSWSFYDWMMRPENRPKLVAVMKGMRGPHSFAASLKMNAGMSTQQLEEQWKAFVMKEYVGGKKKPANSGPSTEPKGKEKDKPKK